MISLQRALAVLLMTGSISSYASSIQNEHDQLNNFEKTNVRTEPVYPPWVSVPQTTDDLHEYLQIMEDIFEKLGKVFEHELVPTYTLFVQYFDKVEDAVARMRYPYEKEGLVNSYLVGVIGRDRANTLTDELAEDERYKTLFGIVAEPPDNYRNENGIPVGYYRYSYSEEETSEEEETSDEKPAPLHGTISPESSNAAS